MAKNPLNNLRAGRVSTIKDAKTGQKIGSSIGPHPQSLKSYRGAKLTTIDDVVKLLKSANRNKTDPLVDLRAYGKFYKDPAKGLKWVSTGVTNIQTLLSKAEDYAQSGFTQEEFADEVFNLDSGETDFVVQWFVKYK